MGLCTVTHCLRGSASDWGKGKGRALGTWHSQAEPGNELAKETSEIGICTKELVLTCCTTMPLQGRAFAMDRVSS
jgi:hypothetical protein